MGSIQHLTMPLSSRVNVLANQGSRPFFCEPTRHRVASFLAPCCSCFRAAHVGLRIAAAVLTSPSRLCEKGGEPSFSQTLRRGQVNPSGRSTTRLCPLARAEAGSSNDAAILRSSGSYSIRVSVRARCHRDSPILSWRFAPPGLILIRPSGGWHRRTSSPMPPCPRTPS